MQTDGSAFFTPFNGPVEIGLRALSILTESYPLGYSLQRLIISDYLIVHSDDIQGGPPGLHPQTPHRGGEILVRRSIIQDGLLLYQSRDLIERRYENGGVFFAATDRSADFLDSLDTPYVLGLKKRAEWIVETFGHLSDQHLEQLIREQIGKWGTEFTMESVLWSEESP
jgi:hypothetical protein